MTTKKISATEERLRDSARVLLDVSAELNPQMPVDERWVLAYKALELIHGSKWSCNTSHEYLWDLFLSTASREGGDA